MKYTPPERFICQQCGQSFYKDTTRKNLKYCSERCRARYHMAKPKELITKIYKIDFKKSLVVVDQKE